jgi:GxxExxY protein
MTENELAKIVVDVAYQIHSRLGPGLLESVYHAILLHELRKRGLHVEKKVPIPVVWEEVRLEVGFEADLIVESKLVLELKSVEQTAPVHKKQLLTYLRLTNCRLGLLLNFGAALIKDGIFRVVNNLSE